MHLGALPPHETSLRRSLGSTRNSPHAAVHQVSSSNLRHIKWVLYKTMRLLYSLGPTDASSAFC